MENIKAQESQNSNFLILNINNNNKVHNFYANCCSDRRDQEERIKQKTAQSKSDIQEFFSLKDVQKSKFKLPPEIVETICNFVIFNEKASHSKKCIFNFSKHHEMNNRCNPYIWQVNSIKDISQNVIIHKLHKDVITCKWHEEWHSKEKDKLLDYLKESINKLTLQQSEEDQLALYPDLHHNQGEIHDKILGDVV